MYSLSLMLKINAVQQQGKKKSQYKKEILQPGIAVKLSDVHFT